MTQTVKNYIRDFSIILVGMLIIIGLYSYFTKYDELELNLKEANNKIEQLTKTNGTLVKELAIAKENYVNLDTATKTETQVVYVEKESPNDSDVVIQHELPTITVKAGDGKEYQYTPDAISGQIMKDGKAVVVENNQLTLDIEKIVDDRYKDKIAALQASHDLEIKKANDELANVKRKLSITKKQRDFYAGVSVITVGTGTAVMINKNF